MDGQRLDGWKAIANFLGRDRTTAIRWANHRGLPVHRVPGGRTGAVFARTAELEHWLDGTDRLDNALSQPIADQPPAHQASNWLRRHTLKILALSLTLLIAATLWKKEQPKSRTAVPVGIAAIVAPSANAETVAFADAVTADLARFANASDTLAVFERDNRIDPDTRYVVYTNIDRGSDGMIADVRLVTTANREVMWSRRFVQTSSLAELRAQLAAKLIGVIRCSLDSLEDEHAKTVTSDVAQVMAICDAFDEGDLDRAAARARKLTETSPRLAIGWALRATIEGNLAEQGNLDDRGTIRSSAARAMALAPDAVLTAIARAAAAGPGASPPHALPIIEEALQRHPEHPWLLSLQSMMLFNLGYVEASVAPAIASVRDDPTSLVTRDIAVRRLAAAGRIGEALALQSESEQLWPGHPSLRETRARIVGAASAAQRLEGAETPSNPYFLASEYERRGNRAAALRWLDNAPVERAQMQWSLLFWPDAAGLRTEPAFFQKMKKLGLVKWWIARKQWPDFCAEPNLKYNCDVEARKL